MALLSPLVTPFARRYRHLGADLPFGDPLPSHRAEMEGYFWRVTDVATRRVVVALCGVNRHPDGDWATVAVALHPEHVVRSAVVDDAVADESSLHVRAGNAFEADGSHVRVRLPGVRLDLDTAESVGFPRGAFAGGGLASVLPGLNQYWHPYTLGGSASGTLELDGCRTVVSGELYREKNWGRGFPPRWWWGQAHGFERPDVCVAFAGGHLAAGRRHVDISGIVVRIGPRVVRLAPPSALVRSEIGNGRFHLVGRTPRTTVRIDGRWSDDATLDLPVPLPSERRQALTDREDLAGAMRVEVRRDGRRWFAGTSHLAALEVGTAPTPSDLGE